LFSEAAVSPDGIHYRPAHLKGPFSTVTFPPGPTLLPPGAGEKTLIFQHWPLLLVLIITFSTGGKSEKEEKPSYYGSGKNLLTITKSYW